MENMHPNQLLKHERLLRGWSQEKVALEIGVDTITVSRWERGGSVPYPIYREKLCQLFGKNALALGFMLPTSQEQEQPTRVSSSDASLHEAPGSLSPLVDPLLPESWPENVPFIGRDELFAQFKQRLINKKPLTRSVFHGLPGVGKTAFALALVKDQEVQTHFTDGILWVGLGPRPPFMEHLRRWGILLGVPLRELNSLKTTEAIVRRIHSSIRQRRMLLVIDDVWQAEEALMFSVGGPQCTHLFTTRFSSIAHSVSPDDVVKVTELNERDSIKLLTHLAPDIPQRRSETLWKLVQATGGLPLALTLMGRYLKLQSYSGQRRRLEAALEQLHNAEYRLSLVGHQPPLARSPGLAAETPLSLQVAIAVSEQHLDEQARTALRDLSVFPAKPDSFSEEAALAVSKATPEMLAALCDAGLMESSSRGRYMLHQAIADYGRIHLPNSLAYKRLVSYATRFLEEHSNEYEMLARETSILLAALENAYELGMQQELVQCVLALGYFLRVRGFSTQAEEQLQRASEAARALGDDRSRALLALLYGELISQHGNYAQAQAFLQEGLALARGKEDAGLLGNLLISLGALEGTWGKLAEAELHLKEGLHLVRKADNDEMISKGLVDLGLLARRRGDYNHAEAYYQEAIVLARQRGDTQRIISLFINTGALLYHKSDYEQAQNYWLEGLALARQIGHQEHLSTLLNNLAAYMVKQKRYTQAEAFLQEGLVVARQSRDVRRICTLLTTLAETVGLQGDRQRAEKLHAEALSLARQQENDWLIGSILMSFGNFILKEQDYEAAMHIFHEALECIPEGHQDLFAQAHYGLAQANQGLGNLEDAQHQGEQSLSLFQKLGHPKTDEVRGWLANLPVGDAQ